MLILWDKGIKENIHHILQKWLKAYIYRIPLLNLMLTMSPLSLKHFNTSLVLSFTTSLCTQKSSIQFNYFFQHVKNRKYQNFWASLRNKGNKLTSLIANMISPASSWKGKLDLVDEKIKISRMTCHNISTFTEIYKVFPYYFILGPEYGESTFNQHFLATSKILWTH